MTIRVPLTLPAYTPSSWELTLPGYPVISTNFRSSSYPDILGSLPSDSRWKLVFQNMTNAEAFALLLPWKASGCGLWPLTGLPAELAGGVNDINFKRRLTGTTWAIEKEPTKESVKNGRFNVTIELIYELAFDSIYGPRNPLIDQGESPVLLNKSHIISTVGLPVTITNPIPPYNVNSVLSLNLFDSLSISALPVDIVYPIPSYDVNFVLGLAVGSGLTVAAVSPTKA